MPATVDSESKGQTDCLLSAPEAELNASVLAEFGEPVQPPQSDPVVRGREVNGLADMTGIGPCSTVYWSVCVDTPAPVKGGTGTTIRPGLVEAVSWERHPGGAWSKSRA